jgi:hypothetical protein
MMEYEKERCAGYEIRKHLRKESDQKRSKGKSNREKQRMKEYAHRRVYDRY